MENTFDMVKLIYGIVATVCAALLAYAATPAVRVLAFKIGAVDVPLDGRRMHVRPIPRIGGLAIYLAFTITTLLFCDISSEIVTIWIGGAALVIIGILDDIYRLSAWIKMLVQIAVAGFAVWNGSVVTQINLGDEYLQFGIFSIPLTIFWIVGLTNAINFIDGLDGLACGVSAISSLSLVTVLFLNGETVSIIICVVLFGSCLGFLPFNSNPARIFMGDTGSLFLGFTLSILSISGVFKLHAVLSFLVPLVIFALPIFDASFAILRRVFSGKSPFSPDRGHIHHKLIDMGFTQKESVKILYSICGILGLVAVFYSESMFEQMRVVKSVAIAVVAILLFVVNFFIMKYPKLRRHSGLTADDMTISEYIDEMDPEKIKKIEEHNGGKIQLEADNNVDTETAEIKENEKNDEEQ